MRNLLLYLIYLSAGLVACGWLEAAETPPAGLTDYAYLDVPADRRTVIVIGSNFGKDRRTNSNCQTRTRKGDQVGEWHDALDIVRAEEDQYRFKTRDAPDTDLVEVQVKGADGNYTTPAVVGDGTKYWERFITFGSPHDCIGKTVQVRWCRDPKPQLGSKICPNTKHALACQNEGDYVVVGIHFATGTVSKVKISFDYAQIDLNSVGPKSNSSLKRAVLKADANCPRESAFEEVEMLNEVFTPAEIKCFPASNAFKPGPEDVAVFYMFKRKSWPAVLSINNVHIETTMDRE